MTAQVLTEFRGTGESTLVPAPAMAVAVAVAVALAQR